MFRYAFRTFKVPRFPVPHFQRPHVPLGLGGWPLDYEERRCWANGCAIFQPMWSWSTNATDRQTDRETDGRTDDMQSQYRALYYSASRGN